MLLEYLLAVVALLDSWGVHGEPIDIWANPTIWGNPLDCVRIRSAKMSRLIYGTGYKYRGNRARYLAVYNHATIPFNSAFRFDSIKQYEKEGPLYRVRIINTQEFVFGGWTNTATHYHRRPVFSFSEEYNTTLGNVDMWLFEKVYKDAQWIKTWYIKNVWYNEYMIASWANAERPSGAEEESFTMLKLDRTAQVNRTIEHQFFLEDC